jgi:excisionase family DNA binding protein
MSNPFDSYPAILSADQLAELLGISRAGAYQLLHQESFPTLHIGKRMLVPKDKLLIWIDQHTGGTEISV